MIIFSIKILKWFFLSDKKHANFLKLILKRWQNQVLKKHFDVMKSF